MSYRPDDPNDPFNIFCSITERSNQPMTVLYELTEVDTRIIRQARNAVSMLLDGAYRQLETIHQCPNGDNPEGVTPMTKIAYNACFGGFSLSPDAVRLARTLSDNPHWGHCVLKGETWDDGTISMGDYTGIMDDSISRTDPVLTNVIEMLGGLEASGEHAALCIREVPAGTRYRIEEYDGYETIRLESEYTWEVA